MSDSNTLQVDDPFKIKITVGTMNGDQHTLFTNDNETIGDLKRVLLPYVKNVSIAREMVLIPGNNERGYGDHNPVADNIEILSLLHKSLLPIRIVEFQLLKIDDPVWAKHEQDAFSLILDGHFIFSNSDVVSCGEEVFIWILKNKTQELRRINFYINNITQSVTTALLDLIQNPDTLLEELELDIEVGNYNYNIMEDLVDALYHNNTIKQLSLITSESERNYNMSIFFEVMIGNTNLTNINIEGSISYKMRDLVDTLRENNTLHIVSICRCWVDTNAQDILDLESVLQYTNLERLYLTSNSIIKSKDGNESYGLEKREEIKKEIKRLKFARFNTREQFEFYWEKHWI